MDYQRRDNKFANHISFNCPEETLSSLLEGAKSNIEQFFDQIKLSLIEFLFSSEREMIAGPKYKPKAGFEKWGSQRGSVYVGGQKIKVQKPRLRKNGQEIFLSVYQKLKNREQFSEEVLKKALRGISCRGYEGTLETVLESFGLSRSSISRELKVATSQKLKDLAERNLSEIDPFAIFIDGYHIGEKVFIVALSVDMKGYKHVLGFWEGATENHEICVELFKDLERRNLVLDQRTVFVTDGGKGIIKALKNQFGKYLIHQRCTVHKGRNIQKHLPKKYRESAHYRFRNALDCIKYHDAKEGLLELKRWLEEINPSAATSLEEGLEELLTLHKLEVPWLLRKSLHTTNPIESMFSQVTRQMCRITRMRRGKMAQRWLGTALLDAEQRFRRIKGYLSIEEVRGKIEAEYDKLMAQVA